MVFTGETVAELEVPTAGRLLFLGKVENTPGSYLSLMFSSRLRSSSKMDFRDRTDFTISDGATSCRSKNLCRNEDVDEEETFDMGDWFRLPGAVPVLT